MSVARRFVLVGVVAALGCFYWWIARTANDRIYWNRTWGGGFYEYLGRGFARGHLYVPITASPELLAQKDPWNAKLDDALIMHDLAFFNGHYYLYHGVGPAVMLFTPWQLATGYSFPETVAAFLFCFAGFLFASGALLRIFDLEGVKPHPALLAVLLVVLGLCQCVPYLLSRVFMYEVAISAGYFSIAAAFFFLTRAIGSKRAALWMAASGLMFATAISCRPHLGLVGLVALAWVALTRVWTRRREFAAFLVPFCIVGALIAAYNYARFGNPFEFGMRYQLAASASYRDPVLAPRNVPPGLYFMLFCQPEFSPVFPWMKQIFRNPFNSYSYEFPSPYFIERVTGALYMAPMLFGLLLMRRAQQVRGLLRLLSGCALAALAFIVAVGLSAQRFEVDFLGPSLLAALAAFGIAMCRGQGRRRTALVASLIVCSAWGAMCGLLYGITGPYENILRNRPATYVRIARALSPIERFRPLLDPHIQADFSVEFTSQPDGFREPLLTMGDRTWRYFLYAEHTAARLRIVSQTDDSSMTYEMERPAAPLAIRVTHTPAAGLITTTIDGRDVLVHPVKHLVTAPAQITVGENRVEPSVTAERFSGRIRSVSLRWRP